MDAWDAIVDNEFLSFEGLAFVAKQMLQVSKPPNRFTPEFCIMKKFKDWEIRRHVPCCAYKATIPAYACTVWLPMCAHSLVLIALNFKVHVSPLCSLCRHASTENFKRTGSACGKAWELLLKRCHTISVQFQLTEHGLVNSFLSPAAATSHT